ncbi:MAG: MFS transporter [Proteobacteria bacterium]|nr:MFS transporter [Pseudomonadota bacterium]
MRLWQLITLTIFTHSVFNGSRMLVSLYAIHLHASPVTVGALMSFYALLPMVFAVSAGRLVDRVGARWPMFGASVALALGTLLPFVWPRLETLYLTSTLIGTGFMVFHVAVNQVVGALGRPEDRAANFSWLALGFSVSGSLGPLMTGFAIDSIGHARTFLLLFLFPLLPLVVLWFNRPALPQAKERKAGTGQRRVMDLLRSRELRRVFIASGLLSMGWDLYTFVIPIYGSRIGLSASTIGVIMGTFAIATFAVRLVMPLLVRRVKEWHTITAALLITAGTYSLFPFFTSVPLLMALSFVLGIGLGCAQPMVMALLYNSSPPGRQGEAVGVRTTVMNASHTVLPLAFGALGAALGMGPVFWSMAALMGAGAWLVNRRRERD